MWMRYAKVRILYKEIINKCIKCFAMRAGTMNQLMAARVSMFVKPFINTTIDYTGELIYKLNKTKNSKTAKAYIATFVCMYVKAMHLELVTDLTAIAFIAAFRRFVPRRRDVSMNEQLTMSIKQPLLD